MSYLFGEENGVVSLRTAVYGDADWPIVKKSVQLLTPKQVQFQLDSECRDCRPVVKEVEFTTLKLTDQGTLDAHAYGYAYRSGDGHQEVEYAGVLHQLSAQQVAAFDRAVERNHTLLTKIQTHRPAQQ